MSDGKTSSLDLIFFFGSDSNRRRGGAFGQSVTNVGGASAACLS